MELNITHRAADNLFECIVDDLQAKVIYTKENNTLLITGTYVPEELGGKGIAAALTKFALEYARTNNLKVKPICSYTVAYMKRNKEYDDLLETIE